MAEVYIFKQFFENEEFTYGIKKFINSDSIEKELKTVYGGETARQLAHCFYDLTDGNGVVRWANYPFSRGQILPLDHQEIEEFKRELEKIVNESKV